jgi:hypothetical protein
MSGLLQDARFEPSKHDPSDDEGDETDTERHTVMEHVFNFLRPPADSIQPEEAHQGVESGKRPYVGRNVRD